VALNVSNALIIYGQDVIGGACVWPSIGTTVPNGGTLGTNWYGKETANHYSTIRTYTGQAITANNDVVTVERGAPGIILSYDRAQSVTVEWVFTWNSASATKSYLFSKGSDLYVSYDQNANLMVFHRRAQSGNRDEWSCKPGFVNGKTYVLQIAGGAPNTAITVMLNNVSVPVTHTMVAASYDTSWGPYADEDLKIMNSYSQNAAARCTLYLFRFHNTKLSSLQMSQNYDIDWGRVWTLVSVSAPLPASVPVTPRPVKYTATNSPTAGATVLNFADITGFTVDTEVTIGVNDGNPLHFDIKRIYSITTTTAPAGSITLVNGLANAYTTPPVSLIVMHNQTWYENVTPTSSGNVIGPTTSIGPIALPIAGNVGAAAQTPTRVVAARYADVPPRPHYTLTHTLTYRVTLNTIVEEAQ
jgi:hypothetical protein